MKKCIMFTSVFLWVISLFSQNIFTSPQAADFLKTGETVILFEESFEPSDVPVGTLPNGWEVMIPPNQGSGIANWGAIGVDFLGGEANQMRFFTNPPMAGISRLVTNSINVQGHTNLRLTLKVALIAPRSSNQRILIEYTLDDGASWQPIWTHTNVRSYGPVEDEHFFTVPAGTENLRLAFGYDGVTDEIGTIINSFQQDDIVLDAPQFSDLRAVGFRGSSTPTPGETTSYQVEVINGGGTDIPGGDYTVQLFRRVGQSSILLNEVPGVDIPFGQEHTFSLDWTPDASFAGSYNRLFAVINYENDANPNNNTTHNLTLYVLTDADQPVEIGSGTLYPQATGNSSPQKMPWTFWYASSLRQTLYYANEIDMGGGAITAIKYKNNFFSNIFQRDVKIWIAHTNRHTMFGGYEPFENFQLVFDGRLDFPSGENEILIPLQNPFEYQGGNIVVYTFSPWSENTGTMHEQFYASKTANSIRTIGYHGGFTGYNPENPIYDPTKISDWHPNTTFYFSTGSLGSISGLVSDLDGNSINNVRVKIQASVLETQTNELGEFTLPYLNPGTYQIEFSKYGFETQEIAVQVFEDEISLVEVFLTSLKLPEIELSEEYINEAIYYGHIAQSELTIYNHGELELIWNSAFEEQEDLKNIVIQHSEKGPIAEKQPKSEVTLNYDGDASSAIGTNTGGTMHVAARYPSEMTDPFTGYALHSVDVYIWTVPNVATLYIWGEGENENAPGPLLAQQDFYPEEQSWKKILLDNPLVLEQGDIWVGYSGTHVVNQFPFGRDAGPAHESREGSWTSLDGESWIRIIDYPGFDFNWNIRANLTPFGWLNLEPGSAVIPAEDHMNITLSFDTKLAEPGIHTLDIAFHSNDPDNPVVKLPVRMEVLETFQVIFNVVDSEGNTIEDAIITLGSNTQEEGSYEFEYVIPGVYNYSVSADGFETITGQLDVFESITHTVVFIATYLDVIEDIPVSIFPVPAAESINLSFGPGFQTIVFFSSNGDVLFQKEVMGLSELMVNVDSLKPGIYFAMFIGANDKPVIVKRFIIGH